MARLSIVVVAVLTAGGTASAFWTGHGQGDGSVATATTDAVTLSPASPAAQMYPGSSADVMVAISNPNAASVHIGSLALDPAIGTGGLSADSAHPMCELSSFGFTTATNGGAGWTVPGATGGTAGTSAVTLAGALAMSLDAPNGCQGVAVTVYLSAGQ